MFGSMFLRGGGYNVRTKCNSFLPTLFSIKHVVIAGNDVRRFSGVQAEPLQFSLVSYKY